MMKHYISILFIIVYIADVYSAHIPAKTADILHTPRTKAENNDVIRTGAHSAMTADYSLGPLMWEQKRDASRFTGRLDVEMKRDVTSWLRRYARMVAQRRDDDDDEDDVSPEQICLEICR